MCHVHECSMCIYVWFFYMTSQWQLCLCLCGVSPLHLAMIGSLLFHWNPTWCNHMYGKQSIYGSDMHSISKPQIVPMKGLVWHTHKHNHSILPDKYLSQSFCFSNRPSGFFCPQPVTRVQLSVWTLKVFECPWCMCWSPHSFLCFDNKWASLIAVNVSC